MDVAVTHAGAPGVSLWRNVEGKRFERVPLPIAMQPAAGGLTAIDFDNDGWIDLAVVLETARGPELRVLRNIGDQGFEDVSAKLGLDKIKLLDPRSVIAADVDGDNDSDLIVSQLGADPSFCAMTAAIAITRCASTSKDWLTTRQDWGRRSKCSPAHSGRSGRFRAPLDI